MSTTDSIFELDQWATDGGQTVHHFHLDGSACDIGFDPQTCPDYGEDDSAYLDYLARWEAVDLGLATELMPCYRCHYEATGQLGFPGDGPLRGVVRTEMVNGPDPYSAVVLTPCGHVLI